MNMISSGPSLRWLALYEREPEDRLKEIKFNGSHVSVDEFNFLAENETSPEIVLFVLTSYHATGVDQAKDKVFRAIIDKFKDHPDIVAAAFLKIKQKNDEDVLNTIRYKATSVWARSIELLTDRSKLDEGLIKTMIEHRNGLVIFENSMPLPSMTMALWMHTIDHAHSSVRRHAYTHPDLPLTRDFIEKILSDKNHENVIAFLKRKGVIYPDEFFSKLLDHPHRFVVVTAVLELNNQVTPEQITSGLGHESLMVQRAWSERSDYRISDYPWERLVGPEPFHDGPANPGSDRHYYLMMVDEIRQRVFKENAEEKSRNRIELIDSFNDKNISTKKLKTYQSL